MTIEFSRSQLVAALLTAILLGCGAEPPQRTQGNTAAPQEAVTRVGDVSMRASVVQTSTLSADIASRYGIARADTTVMLLVAVRQGSEGQDRSLPATITATATDLRGQRQTVELRELRAGDLLDYVGTVETTLPETLRFDLTIVREGGAMSSMQFSREFYPQ